jgi:ABC-type transporter Mla subunit MlaD
MPLQDLTPQLRTRLNKMERAVGWFVFIAAGLLLFGFGYYIYHTAERKGWFVEKAQFRTYLQSSAGLKVGDPVLMMGSPVGEITQIFPMPPDDRRNVRVDFVIRAPDFRYIRSAGSSVKVNAGFLGQSQLEVTRGAVGAFAITVTQPVFCKTVDELRALVVVETNQWQLSQYVYDVHSNIVFIPYQPYEGLSLSNLDVLATLNLESNSIYAFNNRLNAKHVVGVWREELQRYESYNHTKDPPVELRALESVPVAERVDNIIAQVEKALPNILSITNKLFAVLDNAANATSNLNVTISAAQPMVTNFALISGQLREPGGLATWALGTNGDFQVQTALTNANTLLVSVDTNLNQLTAQIGLTLENVANITSNLNAQVQANSNMLGGISKTVMDADDLMQGLKRHWLLRSAFKVKATNAPPTKAK